MARGQDARRFIYFLPALGACQLEGTAGSVATGGIRRPVAFGGKDLDMVTLTVRHREGTTCPCSRQRQEGWRPRASW